MSNRRTEMDRLQELVRLHRLQVGVREVARLLQMSPNTERQYRLALQRAGLLEGSATELPELEQLKQVVTAALPPVLPPQMTSSVERFEVYVRELLGKGLRPRAIYDRLRLEHTDFDGTYWAIKRMCKRLLRERGVRASDVAIPVVTLAGDVAQVDFGYVGRLYDADSGQLRKAWVFVMVLGHSRRMVARLCFDQTLKTWLRLHVEAFAELGGVPHTLVPDNLRAAVVRAAFGVDVDGTALNRSYRELARHYGFKVDPTPIYSPEKKGKVESGVKYVKGNFFTGRSGADFKQTAIELQRWVIEIANARVHGTTQRRPSEAFEAEERQALLALPAKRFEPVEWKQAQVHRDCHVVFGKRLYSVPWRLVGKSVWVRATSSTVAVYADDARVATHDRRGRGPRSTVEDHLPEDRAPWRHRSRAFWQERAERIAPEVGVYIREVFEADDVLSMLRTVQAIVTHLERFPTARAVAAAQRARFYGSHSYGAIKNMLRQGLDLQPLPTVPQSPTAPATAPRFARPITQLLHKPKDTLDELH
jgi:transposase